MSNSLFTVRGDVADRARWEAFGSGEIHRIAELVPESSSAHASLEKSGSAYSVFAEVQLAGTATLFGHSVSDSPEDAIREAIGKIEKRIEKWQKARAR
jgi:ribosome-associated translation inhibitor RaiA